MWEPLSKNSTTLFSPVKMDPIHFQIYSLLSIEEDQVNKGGGAKAWTKTSVPALSPTYQSSGEFS